MSTIKMMKKWIFISMLFVGISLTVYAVVPQNVFIEQMFTTEIGSTYVDICVTHYGAEHLIVELTEFETGYVQTYNFDVPYAPTSTIHHLYGLAPNTLYNVKVTAIGTGGETHHLYMQVLTEL